MASYTGVPTTSQPIVTNREVCNYVTLLNRRNYNYRRLHYGGVGQVVIQSGQGVVWSRWGVVSGELSSTVMLSYGLLTKGLCG